MILSLVERGWQAARECSLAAQRDGVRITHVIKGRVDPAVCGLHPSAPGVRMVGVARWWFWPWIWLHAVAWRGPGRPCAVLVDNERAQRRVRAWRLPEAMPVWLVRMGPHGYELWAESGRVDQAPWRACGSR